MRAVQCLFRYRLSLRDTLYLYPARVLTRVLGRKFTVSGYI